MPNWSRCWRRSRRRRPASIRRRSRCRGRDRTCFAAPAAAAPPTAVIAKTCSSMASRDTARRPSQGLVDHGLAVDPLPLRVSRPLERSIIASRVNRGAPEQRGPSWSNRRHLSRRTSRPARQIEKDPLRASATVRRPPWVTKRSETGGSRAGRAGATRGDRDAYQALARASASRLDRTASPIVRDTDRADDAVQQTLVAMWRELPSLREPDRLEACSQSPRSASVCSRRIGPRTGVREVQLDELTPARDDAYADADLRDQLDRARPRCPPITARSSSCTTTTAFRSARSPRSGCPCTARSGSGSMRPDRCAPRSRRAIAHPSREGNPGMIATSDFDRLLSSVLDETGRNACPRPCLRQASPRPAGSGSERHLVRALDRQAWPARRISIPAIERQPGLSRSVCLVLTLAGRVVDRHRAATATSPSRWRPVPWSRHGRYSRRPCSRTAGSWSPEGGSDERNGFLASTRRLIRAAGRGQSQRR